MKMTPWFPPDVKPVHIGEYNASAISTSEVMRWWDGKRWSLPYLPTFRDEAKRMLRSQHASRRFQKVILWRGLAEKPKGAK